MEDFSDKFSAYSNKELLAILMDESSYQAGAVAAARSELERRDPGAEEMQTLRLLVETEKKLAEEKVERSKAASGKVKLISEKLARAYDPVETGAGTEKTILYIATFLVLVFFYTAITQYNTFYYSIVDFNFYPAAAILGLAGLILPLFAAPLFFLKKKSGWVLSAAYFLYVFVTGCFYLLKSINDSHSEYSFIAFRAPPVFQLFVSMVIYGAILYTLIKPKIRAVYKVSGGTVIKTFLFSFIFFILLFAFS